MRAEFERCWPWLQEAMDHSGRTHGKEDIWRLLVERRAFLFPNHNSAILAEIIQQPLMRTGNAWLAGGDLDEILSMVPDLKDAARRLGCHRAMVQGGRPGWVKKLKGWHELDRRLVLNL